MSKESPYFSIVIPTYNRAHLIPKTIASILVQDFSDYEIIIVDDGSKDSTAEVVSRLTDGRISYFKKENAERGAARNYGRTRAKGKYINFFDSDDLMYPGHLRQAKKLIEEKQQPEFFHLGYDFQDPNGVVTKQVNDFDDTIRDIVLFDNQLSCNGVFVRSDIAAEFPFEESRDLSSAEDWELWIRLISRYPLHYSNEITTSVVSHDARSIRTISSDKIIIRERILIRLVENQATVRKMYGKKLNTFIAQRYTFIMLCLSEDRKLREVAGWAFRAILAHPPILFSKRFLVSFKNCLSS